jgi:3-oxoacyl-[acyl-carrier protein] reductase
MGEDVKQVPSYVVLGAYGGIGSALSRRLVQRGARLLVAGRDRGRVEALARELAVEGLVVDATRPAEVEACLVHARERFGRVDGAANCVGSLLLKPAHLTSEEQWHQTLDTNLGSAFALVRAAGKTMAAEGGSVILVSSAAARVGMANHEAIAAAKAGVIGLMLAAAATYAPSHIRVNAVAPGLVETPLTERLTASEPARRASLAMHAAGRLGRPEDVASLIDWLLLPQNDWITGQVFGVDGGLATLRPRPPAEPRGAPGSSGSSPLQATGG